MFAPDDLSLVKGGPAERRRYLDDTLVALHPRHDAVRATSTGSCASATPCCGRSAGRLDPSAAITLDVWDAKLAAAGEALAAARAELVDRLGPEVRRGVRRSWPGRPTSRSTAVYEPPWRRAGLAEALAAGRADDLRRGVTLVGPHRDELDLAHRRPAGPHPRARRASSGRWPWRCGWRPTGWSPTAIGAPPVLLLDDVFSELDPDRSEALLAHLPAGQAVLTTAGGLPPGATPEQVLVVEDGKLGRAERRP